MTTVMFIAHQVSALLADDWAIAYTVTAHLFLGSMVAVASFGALR